MEEIILSFHSIFTSELIRVIVNILIWYEIHDACKKNWREIRGYVYYTQN